ncbi:MAG: hypothetical protein IJR14_09750, partial [Synergistaceae bacterium]|nr:hypothetical protein [Synergistaceae bacterium]
MRHDMTKRTFLAALAALTIAALAVPAWGAWAPGNFLYGVETHMARLYDWTTDEFGDPKHYGLVGATRDATFAKFLELIDDLGVSLVRDGSHFDDLMPRGNAALNFSTMAKILPELASRDIVLDWVLVSTPGWAVKSAYETVDPKWNCPPSRRDWENFLGKVAEESAPWSDRIIYELWNEPNLKGGGFWKGTAQEYLDLLEDGTRAIRRRLPEAVVTNGGMVTRSADIEALPDEPVLYARYGRMVAQGSLALVSIHSHGSIDTLAEDFKDVANHAERYGIDRGRILLNESGHSTLSDDVQALNVAGKAIWAHAHGLAGYVAFYLGCMDREANADLAEGAPETKDFSMVGDRLDKTDVKKRMSYAAYKTVIEMLDGAVGEKIIHEEKGRYRYLFSKGTQKIYVAIGGEGSRTEIARELGSSQWDAFDMLG